MKKITLLCLAIIAILMFPFLINGYIDIDLSTLDFKNSFGGSEESNSSIDGTYYGTDGWISTTVEIYGDTWYSEVSFGPYGDRKKESGTVKENTLYSGYGYGIAVGKVSGKSLKYGKATLYKK